MGVQEFKCPGCGAKLKWNAAEQKMKCDYCDNTYDIATLEEFEQEENSAPVEEYAWDPYNAPGEVTGLKTYICQSCGGAITSAMILRRLAARTATARSFSTTMLPECSSLI